ncbi:MAG: hypothetical protein IJ744_00865 [Lachnospiraceae bacterium]|nr:hypothetical protein [Lachnospiraceae bacterium]
MKIIDMECPNCTAPLKVDTSKKRAVCEHCGATFLLDDESHLLWMDHGDEVVDITESGRSTKSHTKLWITLGVIGFVILALAILLPWNARRKKNAKKYQWNTIALHEQLPQPPSEYGSIIYSNQERFDLEVRRISEEQFNAYRSECLDWGYGVERKESKSYYEAFREDGYYLDMWYDEREQEMEITLNAPKALGTLHWPTSALGLMVPEPDSKVGRIDWEDTNGFTIYVGETGPEAFSEYIDRCLEHGFNVNYSRSTDNFSAKNDIGVKLYVYYEGLSVMSIHADASEVVWETETEPEETTIYEETSETVTEEPSSEETPTETTTERVTRDPGEVREDLRQFLVDYEAFVDEYCEFLQKYFSGDQPMAMLPEYMKYAGDYLQWSLKAESWATDLTEAETALFSEVMLRCTSKVAAFAE